ncbi:MAG: hypothetical protein EBS09_09220 [Flavobacteriia bacterium]|nr:hypothetical protein [Flavobacteriia bacterium]
MMRQLIFFFLLVNTTLFASKHEMKLTFMDGYNNQKIANKEVLIKMVKPNFSGTFITDENGSITISFKSGDKIEYQVEFSSGDFDLQKRERYFINEKNADITLYLYPSEAYEKRIQQAESKQMAQYKEIWGDSICTLPKLLEGADAIQNFIYDNLRMPNNYGDFGFEAHFKIEFILGPDGKPYLIHILESTDENLNKEALRLIRLMPRWMFAECENKNYKRKMTIPLDID